MGGFNNPVSGALALIRAAIRSPNFVSGQTGWTINKDGTAEFNTLGGSLQISDDGMFFYVPVAASGTLRLSITTADGIDQYGNIYKSGLFINQEQIWATGDHSETIMINPAGSTFPTITFTQALFGEIARIYARADTNRLVLQATEPGAVIEANGPFVVTGGYQGFNTGQGAQPTFATTGAFVEYPAASWSPLTLRCPPSETIAINTMVWGYNHASDSSTLAVCPKVKIGATVIMNPVQGNNGINIVSRNLTAHNTDPIQAFVQYVMGQDLLAGKSGQLLTVVPCWRISSGDATTASISAASMSAYPMAFTQPQSG